MIFLAACALPKDSADTDSEPLEWEHLTLHHAPFAAVVQDADVTWAVSWEGAVVQDWTEVGGGGFSWVDGADARDGALWVATQEGIARWDGAAWADVPFAPRVGTPAAVVVRADGTVAVIANESSCDDCEVVDHHLALWDGAAWTVHTSLSQPGYLLGLAETADGTLVAVGSGSIVTAWDGAGWVDVMAPGEDASLAAVEADGDEIVAVGYGGRVVRGPLDALRVETAGDGDLRAVDVEGGVAWALGETDAWVDDGGGWSAVPLEEEEWADIAAREDGGAVVVGGSTAPIGSAGDAGGFSEVWRQASVTYPHAVWVDDDGAAWLAGYELGRWDAEGLEAWETGSGSQFTALDGSGPDDVVAVEYGAIASWDGSAWTLTDVGAIELTDVSVVADGAAFAVGRHVGDEGEAPAFFRREGGVWGEDLTALPSSARMLVAVEAFAADDVYAVTGDGTVQLVHWDGSAWAALADLGGEYSELWGRAGDDLYLGGDGLLRWDGASVTVIDGAPADVADLAGDASTLLVAGAGVVTSWRDGAWDELLRSDDDHAVSASETTWVVIASTEGWRLSR